MKEIIYLIVDETGVQSMRKNLPFVRRGEIPVKLTINMPKEAFEPPVLAQEVYVEDWRQGINIDDVEFKQSIITGEEAEGIRQRRLEKMREVLESQGFTITAPEEGAK